MMSGHTMWDFTIGRFTIVATIEACQDALDLSWDDTGETASNINDGTWEAFDTTVAVKLKGVTIGEAHLGESIYADPKDFFTEHYGLAAKGRADGCNYGSYFPDMVREALGEARTWMMDAGVE